MTPEKLGAWAEWVRENAGAGFAFSFRNQNLSPVEFAASLDRLAAKMREPDGWVCRCTNGGDDNYSGTEEWISTGPDDHTDSCRPILYLDSLEGDDE